VLGASLVLKQSFSRTWEQAPVSAIFNDIAQMVMFATDIDDPKVVYPQFSNPGQSGWRMLRRLAEDFGYTVYARNTQLYFLSPSSIILRKGGNSPTFHTDAVNQPGTIVTFESEGPGDFLTLEGRQNMNHYVYGVDPVAIAPIQAGSSPAQASPAVLARHPTVPVVDRLETSSVVSTPQWAQEMADGAARRNHFPIRACARLAGDPRVSPATGVQLRGVGDKHSGLWEVERAVHRVSGGKYSLDVELGRDSDRGWGSRASGARRVVRPRLSPFASSVDPGPPPGVLVNGVWRSAWGPQRSVASA
jgi:hypothetical protein